MAGISTSMPAVKSRSGPPETESAREILRASVQLLERLLVNAKPPHQRTVSFGGPMVGSKAENSLRGFMIDRIRDRARYV